MKRLACSATIMVAAVTGIGLGCDDAAAPPPHLVADQPAAKPHEGEAARPTTRELLEGPRKPVSLGDLPLTVQAPQGWSLQTLPGTTYILLQGPTPSGEAAIQLKVRPATSAAKLEMIVNGARKELERFPESIRMAELRAIKGARVLEHQRVGDLPRPLPDDDPNAPPSRPMNWTISVFVPRGADYETYELNFVGLTADQYEMDKPLLRGIIDSITVDAAAAAETRPASAPAAVGG